MDVVGHGAGGSGCVTPRAPFRIVDVINLSSSAETLLRDRVLALRAQGFDNRIVCMPGSHVAGLRRAGIPVHTVALPRGFDPWRLLRAVFQLARYLARERVDLVHTHCSVPGAVGRLAAWLAGVPVVIHTVHGFYFHEPRTRFGRRLAITAERWLGRLTHVLLTQNREELGLAHAHDIGPAGRRLWIGNGIDVRRFQPADHAADGTVTLTCVARLEPVKHHTMLLEAAALLARRGEAFRLRLVGEGPLRSTLEARTAQLGLRGIVEFLGRRNDVDRLLADSDVAVLTSLKEGMPRAVLEAMASGLPVVATRVPGTREAIRHGKTGLLVDVDDVHALAGALAFLIADPTMRARMGRRGRVRACAEFDENSIIRSLQCVYQNELRERVPRAGLASPVPRAAATATPGSGHAIAVGRNFSFRLGAQLASAFINLAGLALLGRALSATGYGEYAFYYSLIPLLSSAGDAGVGIVATREIARRPAAARTLLGDAIVLKLAISTGLLALVLGIAGRTLTYGQWVPLALVAAAAWMDFSQDPSIWLLRARERLDLEGLLLLLSQVVWIALLALALVFHRGLLALLCAAPVAYALRALAGWLIATRRVTGPRLAPSRARWSAHLKQGLPFGIAMFGAVLYGRVGVLLLKTFSGAADIACFQAAYLLSQPLGFVASALGLAMFPALSRGAREDGESVRVALRQALRAQLLVVLPLSVALCFLAPTIVMLLFHGRGFGPAAGVLRVLGGGLVLIFFNLVARYALTAIDRQAAYLKAIALGLAVNAGVGLLLVPRFGALGACASYLAAEASISFVCAWSLRDRVRWSEVGRDALRPLAAAAGMAAAMFAVRGAGPWGALPAGALTYGALLVAMGAIRDVDLELVRRIAASLRPRRARRMAPALAPSAEGGTS